MTNDATHLLVGAAARALVLGGRLVDVPGCAGADAPDNMCHLLARRRADEVPGASVVGGWCLEGVRRHGAKAGQQRVIFDHHSLVRLPDSGLCCPSTPVGQTLRFIEDSTRPFDFESLASFNLAVFASDVLRVVRGCDELQRQVRELQPLLRRPREL